MVAVGQFLGHSYVEFKKKFKDRKEVGVENSFWMYELGIPWAIKKIFDL